MHRRKGFSLIETVVTVAVMAVLIAFVAPTVIQKADSADPVRLANDVQAAGTGIQVFATDVKGVFPGDLEDLTQRPVPTNSSCAAALACDSTVGHRRTYAPLEVQQWRGPYLAASIGFNATAELRSGYQGDVQNVLRRFDANRNAVEQLSAPGISNSNCAIGAPVFCEENQLFVAITITDLSPGQLAEINGIIDGMNEVTAPNASGRWRWIGNTGYYMAVPIPQQLPGTPAVVR